MSASDAALFQRLEERVRKLEHMVDALIGEVGRLQQGAEKPAKAKEPKAG